MQLTLNVIHPFMGFIRLNTIANIQLSFEDFWYIYSLIKSIGILSIDRYMLSPRKLYNLFLGLLTSDKD